MPETKELSPTELMRNAATVVTSMQETSSLSLTELAVVFRLAAQACDESAQMYETAQMRIKFRNFKLGGR